MVNSEEPSSKSQRKRDSTALQKLGETLVNLPASQLAKIPLDPQLAKEIAVARGLTAHGAKRRQLQYIGRLMRDVDPQPIQQALEMFQRTSLQAKAHFHKLERWRDQLIAEGDSVIQELLETYPQADRQHLRQLVRNAKKEVLLTPSGAAHKELFRYLRSLEDEK